jgi:hypothetical protein
MLEESARIPLAEILRNANDLVSSGVIKDYALGGALAAMRYVDLSLRTMRISSSSR